LVDVDRDGDKDFITGRSRGDIYWFECVAAGQWKRRLLGKASPSDVGAAAFDVDGDGWVDLVAGGAWYRNTGRPRQEAFTKFVFDADLAGVHDVVAADLNGDHRPDVITMSDRNNLRWYAMADDPKQTWRRHDVGPAVHAGVATGDIDGDGDEDIVRSNIWFENTNGRGTDWKTHENIPFGNPRSPYPLATSALVRDMDQDGDSDLVMTENEIRAGRIAWLENEDGKGRRWRLWPLAASDPAARGAYHTLAVEDFDADGDLDVFTCEMEGIRGERAPRWYIWENLDGVGGRFQERVILDANLGGHEAVVADVDGDGDLDICGKLWRARPDNANEGRNHADFLENLKTSAIGR
jgi:hypothetical protein